MTVKPCLDSFQNMREGPGVAHHLVDSDETALTALRAAGLRVTAPRRAVLVWLAKHPHSTVDAISAGVREVLGTVSTQAVYDVLRICTATGLLRQIEPAGHPARFECRVGDNHHHVVCRRCQRTEDVDCAVAAQPCLEPPDDRRFVVDEAEVVFWGLCQDCVTAGQLANVYPPQGEIRQ